MSKKQNKHKKSLDEQINIDLIKLATKNDENILKIKLQYQECLYTYKEYLPNREYPFYELQALRIIKEIYNKK